MAKYSLFSNDSTPKFAVASRRNKYGVNKKTSHFIKNYELMTAPKKNVLGPPSKEPLYYHPPEPEFVASDFTDSLSTDSLEVVPEFVVTEDDGPKYKYRYHPNNAYNQEQEYYNKYFGEMFIDNRPPPPSPDDLALNMDLELGEESELGDSTVVEKKKKGLFKKKEKSAEPEDEGEVDPETLEKAQEKADEEKPTPIEEPEE